MEKAIHEDFLHNGLFQNVLKRVKIDNSRTNGQLKLISLLMVIAWLPLVILSFFEGTFFLSEGNLNFLNDYPIHIRLLLALPILIFTRTTVNNSISELTYYSQKTFFKEEKYDREIIPLWQRITKIVNSRWSDVIILTAVICLSILNSEKKLHMLADSQTQSTWFAHLTAAGWQLTKTGWWYLFVSSVVFQYHLMRWLLKYLVWIWFIRRFAKANIELHPSHPDRACGLEIFVRVQQGFIPIFIAIAIALSAMICQRVNLGIIPFNTAKVDIAAYIVMCIIILFVPLLFFSAKLISVKKNALLEYGIFGVRLSERTKQQITTSNTQNINIREQVDLSALADFSDCYAIIKEIRIAPFTIKQALAFAVILTLPFIPVFLTQMSLKDLIERLAGLLM